MKPKPINLLVGASVVIDFPGRWKSCRDGYREQMRDETQRAEPLFGKPGVIVAYAPSEEKPLKVLLEDGSLVSLFDSNVSITALPTSKDRTEELLEKILAALTSSDIKTIGNEA